MPVSARPTAPLAAVAVARLGPASPPVWDATAGGVLVITLTWLSA
ncbi:hypothetical protein P3102_31170 [Amycolatopsis sp. QT-25]|nr:hypothetical protein [Amycolatopsis sp. QT-25]WET78478.1 hypothetical protein P3102_31170 [Amycolatopsis sp. QT-25]